MVWLSVYGAGVDEGDSGRTQAWFDVNLSQPALDDVSFDWTTTDHTAQADVDYLAASDSATVPAGSDSAMFAVDVVGDTEVEEDETFGLAISNIVGAHRADWDDDTVTIYNDDVPLLLSVYGPSTYEGDSGATEFTFDAYLTRVADTDVTFEWSNARR